MMGKSSRRRFLENSVRGLASIIGLPLISNCSGSRRTRQGHIVTIKDSQAIEKIQLESSSLSDGILIEPNKSIRDNFVDASTKKNYYINSIGDKLVSAVPEERKKYSIAGISIDKNECIEIDLIPDNYELIQFSNIGDSQRVDIEGTNRLIRLERAEEYENPFSNNYYFSLDGRPLNVGPNFSGFADGINIITDLRSLFANEQGLRFFCTGERLTVRDFLKDIDFFGLSENIKRQGLELTSNRFNTEYQGRIQETAFARVSVRLEDKGVLSIDRIEKILIPDRRTPYDNPLPTRRPRVEVNDIAISNEDDEDSFVDRFYGLQGDNFGFYFDNLTGRMGLSQDMGYVYELSNSEFEVGERSYLIRYLSANLGKREDNDKPLNAVSLEIIENPKKIRIGEGINSLVRMDDGEEYYISLESIVESKEFPGIDFWANLRRISDDKEKVVNVKSLNYSAVNGGLGIFLGPDLKQYENTPRNYNPKKETHEFLVSSAVLRVHGFLGDPPLGMERQLIPTSGELPQVVTFKQYTNGDRGLRELVVSIDGESGVRSYRKLSGKSHEVIPKQGFPADQIENGYVVRIDNILGNYLY